MARARHDIDGRNTAGLRTLQTGRSGVDTVKQAYIRLDRRGSISSRTAAYMTVRINQSGHDNSSRKIYSLNVGGKFHGPGIADSGDLSILDKQKALLDRCAYDRDYPGVNERRGLLLSYYHTNEQADHRCDRKHAFCHIFFS
jgi:hypothetical protein